MNRQHKTRALALLGAALVLLVIVSASLSQLAFAPGRPFSLARAETESGEGASAAFDGGVLLLVVRGLLVLALVLLPVAVIVSLLTPEGRRRLIASLGTMLVLALLLSVLPRNAGQGDPLELEPSGPQELMDLPLPSGPTDEFVASVPAWFDRAAIGLLALLIAGTVVAITWWARRRAAATAPPLERLAQEAQSGIDALQAGEDTGDAVIRSYIQMSRVLEEEQGIRRESVMTPHEFEQLLARHGLPAEPVHTLTQLFELVRYGHYPVGEAEEQSAIRSLEAIVGYCRSAGAHR